MSKTITVKTERGNLNSLKWPVRVAFTFTPDESNGPSHPYYTRAVRATSFGANGEESISCFPWFQLGFYTVENGDCKARGPCVSSLHPGNAVTLDSSTPWSSIQRDDTITSSSTLVINKSGNKQAIVVASWNWQIAYHPLENGSSISIPSSWKFQGYIVDDSVTEETILRPEDLTRPIIPAPVLFNILPAESTWILYEDEDGVVQLKNDQFNPIKPKPPKKDPLVEVLERLAAIELSINRIQDDVATGQKAIDDLRNQFSASNGEVRSDIAAMEAKTSTLADSFGQSQDHLAEIRGAVAGTQQLLDGTRNRVSTLEESTNRTQSHVTTVEKAVHQTQDHVSLVQQMVVATNTHLSMVTLIPGATTVPESPSPSQGQETDQSKRIPAVEARVEKLEKSVQEQRKALRKLPKLEADMGTVQASIAGLESRVTTIEVGSVGDDAEDENPASSPSLEASPITFPTHLND